jgi:hypothetical protein
MTGHKAAVRNSPRCDRAEGDRMTDLATLNARILKRYDRMQFWSVFNCVVATMLAVVAGLAHDWVWWALLMVVQFSSIAVYRNCHVGRMRMRMAMAEFNALQDAIAHGAQVRDRHPARAQLLRRRGRDRPDPRDRRFCHRSPHPRVDGRGHCSRGPDYTRRLDGRPQQRY